MLLLHLLRSRIALRDSRCTVVFTSAFKETCGHRPRCSLGRENVENDPKRRIGGPKFALRRAPDLMLANPSLEVAMQFGRLERRKFCSLLGTAAVWPFVARAQQGATQRRIVGFPSGNPHDPSHRKREGGAHGPRFSKYHALTARSGGSQLTLRERRQRGHADIHTECQNRS
jgi:hypothetical protein